MDRLIGVINPHGEDQDTKRMKGGSVKTSRIFYFKSSERTPQDKENSFTVDSFRAKEIV